MQPPSLSTYQAAANAVYAPQQAADNATALATDTTTKADLEAEKPQVATDYESAIDKLTQSVQDQTGQIAQLYAKNLGGNFSGLQANSMSQMFSQANEQQSIISQTEANKLAQITTSEGDADINYQAALSANASKYQGEEADYANSNYDTALSEYNTQEGELERSEISAASKSSGGSGGSSSAAISGKGYSVKQLSSGNKAYTGPNGQTNLYQYASAVSGGDATQTYNTILSELKTGSTTDKGAYNEVKSMSQAQGIAYLQKHNSYIFD